uniref:Uncharacterized protein n=1 Tax=Roya anglica TaxID=43943 RepID=A0A024B3P2_9VIRI|nr:hypothetical protein [Roya anglica]YP_009033776.1 hypothetical protein [Roya anglica]AHZ11144.1 hypothetical protein [Roya anglica]AHZ11159.1 hypothetical protein [Roya anglica]
MPEVIQRSTDFRDQYRPPSRPSVERAAYHGTNFWEVCLEGIESKFSLKKYLKRIFYKALNGGQSETWEQILNTLRTHYKDDQILWQPEGMQIARTIQELPLIKELVAFQKTLSERDSIYLPTMEVAFVGRNRKGMEAQKAKDRPSKSQFHGGLMTSRLFAGQEFLLFMITFQALLREEGCIPICGAHDGIYVLVQAETDLKAICKHVTDASVQLLGIEIQLDVKETGKET